MMKTAAQIRVISLHALLFSPFLPMQATALAEPIITAVSGPVRHDATATITGARFGTKPLPSPEIWDDVESGNFNTTWTSTHGLQPQIESRTPFSSFSGYLNFTSAEGDGYFQAPPDVVDSQSFVSYWFKLEEDWDWGTSVHDDATDRFLSNIN